MSAGMYDARQAYELVLLMLAIWREARGETEEAQLGVGWVIRNRVKKPGKPWYAGIGDDDWEEVVLKPWQFSSFNAKDPNAVKFPLPGESSFTACMLAAKRAYDATAPDPTGGATFYYDDSIQPPSWAATMDFTCKIGRLNFYKERA